MVVANRREEELQRRITELEVALADQEAEIKRLREEITSLAIRSESVCVCYELRKLAAKAAEDGVSQYIRDIVLALATMKPGHEAWEWWAKHPRRLYYDLRSNGFSTQEDGPWQDTPLDAVQVAMQAAEEKT